MGSGRRAGWRGGTGCRRARPTVPGLDGGRCVTPWAGARCLVPKLDLYVAGAAPSSKSYTARNTGIPSGWRGGHDWALVPLCALATRVTVRAPAPTRCDDPVLGLIRLVTLVAAERGVLVESPASRVDHHLVVTIRRASALPIAGPPASASGSRRGEALPGPAGHAVEGSELGSKCCCCEVLAVVPYARHQPTQTIRSASEVDQGSPKRFGGELVLRRWRVGSSEQVNRGAATVAENQVGALVADDGQLLMLGGAGRIEHNVRSVGCDARARDSAGG